MKVEINNKVVLELNETQKKVIKNDIPSAIFDGDMTRRVRYWLESPCEKFVYRHRKDIEKNLAGKGIRSIPSNPIKLGAMLSDRQHTKKMCSVGLESFELSEDHLKIWDSVLEKEKKSLGLLDAILENRAAWILAHKYEKCLERLKLEWIPKLEARGIESIPVDNDEFAELVFSQSDYKDRDAKDLESEAS